MESEFGFKDLEQVLIKATHPIEINGKTFEVGETVAAFDKIQLSNFKEVKKFITANGGLGNQPRVWWETTENITLNFVQGIFSRTQFAVLNNAKLLSHSSENILLNCLETIDSDGTTAIVKLSHAPFTPLFVYEVKTGKKLVLGTDYIAHSSDEIEILDASLLPGKFLFDYQWEYSNGYSSMTIGQQLSNGTFVFTGKTRIKDDITGLVKTAFIRIPKFKLMTSLNMSLGEQATPVVGKMNAMACPQGNWGLHYVMEIIFLEDDIDADM